MKFAELHGWKMDCRAAIALQQALAGQVRLESRLSQPVATVAGVDFSYEKHGNLFFAAVVVLELPTVGCAKSRLCGEHAEPGSRRGGPGSAAVK